MAPVHGADGAGDDIAPGKSDTLVSTSRNISFTFICPPGKTHSHRTRGDTPWRAQKHRSDRNAKRSARTTHANMFEKVIMKRHSRTHTESATSTRNTDWRCGHVARNGRAALGSNKPLTGKKTPGGAGTHASYRWTKHRRGSSRTTRHRISPYAEFVHVTARPCPPTR